MKKFMLITNNEKKRNIESTEYITSLIEKRGGSVAHSIMPAPTDPSSMDVPDGTDMIIAIGGDGTIVRSAQRTIGSGVPIIGVNRGHLGYLCEINDDNLENSIDQLMVGSYYLEKRMMLSGEIENSQEPFVFNSLNDIVLTSKNNMAVIKICVYVNGTFLYAFNGDGIIVATPTGSTAYNLSSGGPIVEPNTELMLLTPVNPHSLNRRSIVLDSSDEIELVVESRRSTKFECAFVAFDGAHRRNLSDGDKVIVKKAKEKIEFVRLDLDKDSFVERMQKRLGG